MDTTLTKIKDIIGMIRNKSQLYELEQMKIGNDLNDSNEQFLNNQTNASHNVIAWLTETGKYERITVFTLVVVNTQRNCNLFVVYLIRFVLNLSHHPN